MHKPNYTDLISTSRIFFRGSMYRHPKEDS
jgi:hypothetical protein